jgi:hypothetical protein
MSRITMFLKAICTCVRSAGAKDARAKKIGGARRDRTDDIVLAKHALSQLSYGPKPGESVSRSASAHPNLTPPHIFLVTEETWWAWEDLNFRPHAYQARALTN